MIDAHNVVVDRTHRLDEVLLRDENGERFVKFRLIGLSVYEQYQEAGKLDEEGTVYLRYKDT